MTILRHYALQATDGREAELGEALAVLAEQVRACAGCERAVVFVEAGDARRYVFIEHWRTAGDRDAAGAALGKGAFDPIFVTLAGRPEACDLIPVAGYSSS